MTLIELYVIQLEKIQKKEDETHRKELKTKVDEVVKQANDLLKETQVDINDF